MEASLGYSASKSLHRLHTAFKVTLTDPYFTPKDRVCAAYRSICLCFVCKDDCFYYLCYINLFWLSTQVSSNFLVHHWYQNNKTKQNKTENQKTINISRDFPLVQPFSCSPLKGRENDALEHPVECSRYWICTLWCSIALCWFPLGRSLISSLPALYFALICRSKNR